MATRKKLTHDAKTRERIQTSQIINRLTKHILGEVEMSASQVSAALGLIKKTLPDLSAVEMNANVEQTHYVVDSQPLSQDEWLKKHAQSGDHNPAHNTH